LQRVRSQSIGALLHPAHSFVNLLFPLPHTQYRRQESRQDGNRRGTIDGDSSGCDRRRTARRR